MRRLCALAIIALAAWLLGAVPALGLARYSVPPHGLMAPARTSRPMIRVTPSPGARTQTSVTANQQSSNWAGYAVATNLTTPAANSVSDVIGTWVVPTVTGGTTDAYSVDWVGIDGFSNSSGSVEQLGTEADWVNGAPSYLAWWEMYPAPMQPIPMAVSPGDVVTADVHWISGNTFTLSLTDVTTGDTFSTQQTLATTARRDSAEWIHEAPSLSTQILPLTQTTPVTFTGCDTTVQGTTGSIGDAAWQNTGIDLSQNSTLIAQASGLSAGGSSFTVARTGQLPHISASSASLTFNYTVGGATPPAQPLAITNTGGGTLSWSAASDSPSWLSCSPTSGSSGASTSVSVSPSGLVAGQYNGHVVVSASGADNTPLSVPVTLVVHPAPPPPDATPPTTTLHATPTPNVAGWNDTDVLLGLHAADNPGGSGVAATYYTLNGGARQSYVTTFSVSAPGTDSVDYWSVDASGNAETTKTASVRIDTTAPSLTLDAISTYNASATVEATASDALSGLDRVEMRLDGGSWVAETRLPTSVPGSHTVDARAFDVAGNESTASAAFTVVGPPVVPITLSTTTNLSGPSSVKPKRTLTLTGRISYPAAPGRVTISRSRLVGGKWKHVGSATVAVTNGAFRYSFKPGYKGSWRLVATYSGGSVGSTTYTASRSPAKSVKVK